MLSFIPPGVVAPLPGGTVRPGSNILPSTCALVLAFVPLCLPATGIAQHTPARDGAGVEVGARLEVAPVLSVEPAGAVHVTFRTSGDGRWLEADRTVKLDCAANVPHVLVVRRTGDRETAGGEIQWSAGRGDWRVLSGGTTVVRDSLRPGRNEECASVAFRRSAPGSSGSGEGVARITVDFDLLPRPPGP